MSTAATLYAKMGRRPSNCGSETSLGNRAFVTSTSSSRLHKPSESRDGPVKTSTTLEDSVIEEKRRRVSGDGYTTHKYTIGRLLGKGGFAKVYLCTAMDSGKNYAVKVVPKANLVKARSRQKVRLCTLFV